MLKIDKKRIIILIAVIGLLVFLHLTRILWPVENALTKFLSPIMSDLYSFSTNIRSAYNKQSDKETLVNKIKQLEAQTNQLVVENVKLKVLEEENRILREYLKFFTEQDYHYVLSNVISRGESIDPADREQIMIIDKGLSDGIIPGLPVLSSKGIIIGKVAQVEDNLSKIHLTVNDRCRLAATIQNQDNTIGITEGELGLTIMMKFIPQTEEVKSEDIVITSGLEKNIPRGLVIGKVSLVNKDSNELWQKATIEPLVDFDDLVIVSVLLP